MIRVPESSFRKMVDIVEENFYKSQELNAERVVDHTYYEP